MMAWFHGDPTWLVGDVPGSMTGGDGVDPLVYDLEIHDGVGKLNVESLRWLDYGVEVYFFFSWKVIEVWMTCVVVIFA